MPWCCALFGSRSGTASGTACIQRAIALAGFSSVFTSPLAATTARMPAKVAAEQILPGLARLDDAELTARSAVPAVAKRQNHRQQHKLPRHPEHPPVVVASLDCADAPRTKFRLAAAKPLAKISRPATWSHDRYSCRCRILRLPRGQRSRIPRCRASAGRGLAEAGIRLVYGGGRIGLMGVMADAALAAGGAVIGVIPEFLTRREVAHAGITELIVTDTMHSRKQRMFELPMPSSRCRAASARWTRRSRSSPGASLGCTPSRS